MFLHLSISAKKTTTNLWTLFTKQQTAQVWWQYSVYSYTEQITINSYKKHNLKITDRITERGKLVTNKGIKTLFMYKIFNAENSESKLKIVLHWTENSSDEKICDVQKFNLVSDWCVCRNNKIIFHTSNKNYHFSTVLYKTWKKMCGVSNPHCNVHGISWDVAKNTLWM